MDPVVKNKPLSNNDPLVAYWYEVQAGDTLTEIARKQGTTVDILLSNNPHLRGAVEGDLRRRDAQGNWIYPGDEVVIYAKKELINFLRKGEGENVQKIISSYPLYPMIKNRVP